MHSYINEILTGEYDHDGKCIIYGDTDSIDKDSVIKTNIRDMTVEELFAAGTTRWKDGKKEYSANPDITVLHHDPATQANKFGQYNYVYRHKVSKKKYRITTADGNSVTVTEDHSVMVINAAGELVECKPSELAAGDKVVTINP